MKKYLSLLLLLLVSLFFGCKMKEKTDDEAFYESYNKFMEKYKSTEREEYYHFDEDEDWVFEPYKPLDSSEVKSYKNKFFEFDEIEDFTPYNDALFHTPFQDSLFKTSQFLWYEPRQFIGDVDKYNILKYERKDNVEAIVYWESVFQQSLGVYIGYSEDAGKTWAHYYTGIIQERPLFVKWYSKYPLITSNGDLQIEVCLMRKASDPELFGYVPYELVQDGLLITIDLETLSKDTDADGLTDIEEAKLRTNPNDPDTDGDGIPDNLDMNPRYNLPRTEKTLIYEAVINEDLRAHHFWDEESYEIIPFSEIPEPHYFTDTTRTELIVTDNLDLLAIQPTKERVVFLTEDEFESTKDKFVDEKEGVSFSPLFKVDKEKDAYVFDVGGGFWSNDYVAVKKKEGWWIRVTSSIIE